MQSLRPIALRLKRLVGEAVVDVRPEDHLAAVVHEGNLADMGDGATHARRARVSRDDHLADRTVRDLERRTGEEIARA